MKIVRNEQGEVVKIFDPASCMMVRDKAGIERLMGEGPKPTPTVVKTESKGVTETITTEPVHTPMFKRGPGRPRKDGS